MKVLICGARDFDNVSIIDDFVRSLPKDTIIIEGEAKGADSIARDCAIKYGLKVEGYKPDWSMGKVGGVLRNTRMLFEGKPDYVVGYSKDIKTSKGTKNMLTQALKANVPTFLNITNMVDIDLNIGKITLEDLK